jgi:hypothetical protein
MSTSRRLWSIPSAAVFAFAAALACAPSPQGAGTTAAATRPSSDVITGEELADPSLAGSTVLEAIRRLRPRFLSDRGGGRRSEEVQVSVNGSALMPASELARMSVSEVSEIRYLSLTDANQRFGLGQSTSPVLLISIRPR